MSLAYADVFARLAHALPGFLASDDDWKEASPYFFLSDMVHFICELNEEEFSVQVTSFANLLEELVSEGDRDVQDLVLDGMEGLTKCERREAIAGSFGPKARAIWVEVYRRSILREEP